MYEMLDDVEQIGGVERFGQVVGDPVLLALVDVRLLRLGREEDDRDVAVVSSSPSASRTSDSRRAAAS